MEVLLNKFFLQTKAVTAFQRHLQFQEVLKNPQFTGAAISLGQSYQREPLRISCLRPWTAWLSRITCLPAPSWLKLVDCPLQESLLLALKQWDMKFFPAHGISSFNKTIAPGIPLVLGLRLSSAAKERNDTPILSLSKEPSGWWDKKPKKTPKPSTVDRRDLVLLADQCKESQISKSISV